MLREGLVAQPVVKGRGLAAGGGEQLGLRELDQSGPYAAASRDSRRSCAGRVAGDRGQADDAVEVGEGVEGVGLLVGPAVPSRRARATWRGDSEPATVPLNSHWVGSSECGSGRPFGYCSAATSSSGRGRRGLHQKYWLLTFGLWVDCANCRA